jgi:hypothetical protein
VCGACGNYFLKDWSWPWLAGGRSATLIARAAERLSRVRGIRVLPAPNGWQVVMPTGSTHLVQSVTALARVAQVDSTTAPEGYLNDSDATSVLDRRRTIKVRAARSERPSPVASGTWSDTLMNPETTVVTIDGFDSTRMLHDLEELAKTVSQAPYRDHIRMLPIPAEITQRVAAHRWTDLPDQIGSGGLPVLCLSVAARLVALPETDTNFREVLVRFSELGTVCIQSVGPTVIAMEVRQSGRNPCRSVKSWVNLGASDVGSAVYRVGSIDEGMGSLDGAASKTTSQTH